MKTHVSRVPPAVLLALAMLMASPAVAQVSGSGGINPPREMDESPEKQPAKKGAEPGNESGLIDLRPKFRMNELLRLRIVQTSEGKTLIQDAASTDPADEQPQSMTQTFEVRFIPKDVRPDGSATVDMVIDSVQMRVKSGDMDASFDSRTSQKGTQPGGKNTTVKPAQIKPKGGPTNRAPDPISDTAPNPLVEMDENQMLASIVQPMVGSVTTYQFDADGNATRISGGEGLNLTGLASMTAGAPGGMPPAAFGEVLNLRPGANRARVGESWGTDGGLTQSPIGGFSMNTRYTLRAAKGDTASIDFAGSMEPNSQGLLGMQVREATFTGDAAWDTGIGFLRTMQARTHVVLEGVIAGNRAKLDTSSTLDVKLIK